MKLYATMTSHKGKREGVGDNTRILVELAYGNKILGTIGLYAIYDERVSKDDVGARVVWKSDITPTVGQVLKEVEKAKKQTGA